MGRLPSAEPRQYQIKQLWECHHEILRRLVIGQKSVEIARDLGVTTAVISYVKNSEVGKRQLSLIRSAVDAETIDVAGRIKELATVAIRVMEEGMDEEQPMGTRLKAATDVLDRAGFGAPRILRTENLHAHLTADDIAEIKERARRMAEETGAIFIEAEVINE